MSGLPRFCGPPAPEALKEALEYSGCAVIESAVTAATLAEIDAELAPWFERAPEGEGLFFGRRTRRFGAVFAKSPASAALALATPILDVLDHYLCRPGGAPAERSDCLQLNLTQAISIFPGESAQLLHRDDALFPITPGFDLMGNVMWALDDFTAANGATRIVPGSHRWERTRQPDDQDIEAAIMPAGSALIWLGSTLHGGGANQSDQPRRGVTISYNLAWLAQAEKLLLTLPPDLVRHLPYRLQRLVGYQVHRPNLGWIEGRDPLQWLHGEINDLGSAQDNLKPEHEALLANLIHGATPNRARDVHDALT